MKLGIRVRKLAWLLVVVVAFPTAFIFAFAALSIEPPSQCSPADHEGVCADLSILYGAISFAAAFASIISVFMFFKPRDAS